MKGKNLLMADMTPDEIAKQINLINVNKSSAIINIKSLVLKDAFDHLKSKLCKIFNAIVGVIPKPRNSIFGQNELGMVSQP